MEVSSWVSGGLSTETDTEEAAGSVHKVQDLTPPKPKAVPGLENLFSELDSNWEHGMLGGVPRGGMQLHSFGEVGGSEQFRPDEPSLMSRDHLHLLSSSLTACKNQIFGQVSYLVIWPVMLVTSDPPQHQTQCRCI